MTRLKKTKQKTSARHEYRCEFLEFLEEELEELMTRLARAGWIFDKFVEVATTTGRLVYALFQRCITDEINMRVRRNFKEEGRRKASRYEPLSVFAKTDPYLAWYQS
jgi:hypothetical protein